MYFGLHVIYPLFLSGFNENPISQQILKNTQIESLTNIRSERAEMLHSGGRMETDRHDDANSLFRNFQTHLNTESYGSAEVHTRIRQPHSKTISCSDMHFYQEYRNSKY